MKKLIVDFAAATGGALTILKEYYEKAKKDINNEYVFLLSDNYLEETNNISIRVLKEEKKWINRLLFDFFTGKKIVKEIRPDYILSLQNTIIRGTDIKQDLYVHQAIPFQKTKKFSFFKKEEFKLAVIQYLIGFCIKSSVRKANKVIVQTKWIKDAIVDSCKIKEEKVEIITPLIDKSSIKKVEEINNKKFIYPTSNSIYKNNDVIYKAVELLNNEGIDDFEIELTIDGESTKCIKKIGRIPREEVYNKISNSILVFSSYIETFGLPLLEARESGTIIIASDTSFSHEILDEYDKAYFFDPFDEKALAALMKKMIKG